MVGSLLCREISKLSIFALLTYFFLRRSIIMKKIVIVNTMIDEI